MPLFINVSIFGLLMVSLTRIGEVVPALAPLHLGKVMLALGIVGAVLWDPKGYLNFTRTPMGKYMALILLLAFAGLPFSVWRGGAMDVAISLARIMLIVVTLFALAENGRLNVYRVSCIISALVLATLMVLDKGTGRLHVGSTYDPNDIALLFVVLLPVIIAEANSAGKAFRIIAWFTAICAVMSIALTQSRGGIIALAAIGVHGFILAKKRRGLLLLLAVLGTIIVLATADEALWQRFSSLADESDYNFDDKYGRISIWKGGIGLLFSHPLSGVGIGQFGAGLGMSEAGVYLTAHNSFIQIGAELGFPGLIAFIMLIIAMVRSCRSAIKSGLLSQKERNRRVALLVSITGYCCGGFFLSQAYGMIFYSLVIMVALTHVQGQKLIAGVLQARQPDSSKETSALPDSLMPAPNSTAQDENMPPRARNAKKPQATSRRMERLELLAKGDRLAQQRKFRE